MLEWHQLQRRREKSDQRTGSTTAAGTVAVAARLAADVHTIQAYNSKTSSPRCMSVPSRGRVIRWDVM